ncbi:hypothetical protein IWX78_000769 [Mycetocola sp. CAN_C7]|uniref:hypothetical protein n=1 Tax=Mycetocola sp. CAN_C7 TaxID=2787724 RepID=UPI0018CA8244
MKHVTFGEKSLLMGDTEADLLLHYAALLTSRSAADTVDINALGVDGNEVTATFLLGAASSLMAETANSPAALPENRDAVAYMQERIMLLSSPPSVRPQDESMPSNYDDLHF